MLNDLIVFAGDLIGSPSTYITLGFIGLIFLILLFIKK